MTFDSLTSTEESSKTSSPKSLQLCVRHPRWHMVANSAANSAESFGSLLPRLLTVPPPAPHKPHTGCTLPKLSCPQKARHTLIATIPIQRLQLSATSVASSCRRARYLCHLRENAGLKNTRVAAVTPTSKPLKPYAGHDIRPIRSNCYEKA